MRRRKEPEKQQRQDNLTRIRNLAAALYWLVSLLLKLIELTERLTG